MRAIDYLATRPEVDASRVATLGASGGGTTSLLTAAVDERVKVAVVSAYFNTFRDSIMSISHCPDNYVPGLLQDMEMYDIAGLVAPRALFVESGGNDPHLPDRGEPDRGGEGARHLCGVRCAAAVRLRDPRRRPRGPSRRRVRFPLASPLIRGHAGVRPRGRSPRALTPWPRWSQISETLAGSGRRPAGRRPRSRCRAGSEDIPRIAARAC